MNDNSQDKAYRHIKALLIGYRVKPSEQLVAATLADELSISRTPVREALTRLEQEGLVERVGGWGYTARQMQLADVEELFKVREVLEIMAVTEAMPNTDDALVEELAVCLRQADASRRDPALFIACNRDFYILIAAAARNRLLQDMLSLINDRVQLIGSMTVEFHAERAAEILAENRALLSALKNNDGARAQTAVRTHIRKGRDYAMRILRRGLVQRGPEGARRN